MQHFSVRQLTLLALMSLALLGGCGKKQPAADAAKAAPEEKAAPAEKKGAAGD
jgi:predicted small lipoprotein YifL